MTIFPKVPSKREVQEHIFPFELNSKQFSLKIYWQKKKSGL